MTRYIQFATDDGGIILLEAEDEEVFEISIKNKTYFTTNETSGVIYESDENGDPGDEIGVFKNGITHFN